MCACGRSRTQVCDSEIHRTRSCFSLYSFEIREGGEREKKKKRERERERQKQRQKQRYRETESRRETCPLRPATWKTCPLRPSPAPCVLLRACHAKLPAGGADECVCVRGCSNSSSLSLFSVPPPTHNNHPLTISLRAVVAGGTSHGPPPPDAHTRTRRRKRRLSAAGTSGS